MAFEKLIIARLSLMSEGLSHGVNRGDFGTLRADGKLGEVDLIHGVVGSVPLLIKVGPVMEKFLYLFVLLGSSYSRTNV